MAEQNPLDELIKTITGYFEKNTDINIDEVKRIMESYKSNQEDWKKYEIFDRERSYTRNLVLCHQKFELIVLCWNKTKGSPIHSHAGSHCWMKILKGTATEQHYDWPKQDSEMKMTKNMEHEINKCAYISDKIGLHRVLNQSNSEDLVTLHLYSPPITKCEVFCETTGQHETKCMTYYSEDGKVNPQDGSCCKKSQEVQTGECCKQDQKEGSCCTSDKKCQEDSCCD